MEELEDLKEKLREINESLWELSQVSPSDFSGVDYYTRYDRLEETKQNLLTEIEEIENDLGINYDSYSDCAF
ncbi:MAG: hypothetical protein M0Q24_04455 [Sulfurimonas sp.]|uniref:hypothetical protein n=1 Tax=Sulfurimonas sp. TaxID=2022749 RepID=UPI0025FC7F12|nr:hypothetical protein [Sulfurimonas sp.]MCK9491319.1 hypothetical protein [Sulfurimonas sp.]